MTLFVLQGLLGIRFVFAVIAGGCLLPSVMLIWQPARHK
jgi:hypothetical protein